MKKDEIKRKSAANNTWLSKARKYQRILKVLVRLRFQNLMVFRLDFLGPFFVDGSLFIIQLLIFKAIYANVDSIGSWGSGAMILYIGTFSLLNAASMTICFFGILGIPYKIRSGEMDLYLSKPVSPLFRLTFECINPGSLLLVVFSIFIIVYGAKASNCRITVHAVASYLFWLVLMAFLYYIMEVLIRSVSFYLISTTRIEQLEEALLSLCFKLPGIAMYGIYKVIFYCILPYGIMATLPVQSMLGELTWKTALQGIFVVAVFAVITALVWKKGIRHYNSAGS